MNQMKIVQVIPNLKPGGAERVCVSLSNHLSKLGHFVHIIKFDCKASFFELDSNIKIHNCKNSITPIKGNKNLLILIKNISPDIIHTHLHISDMNILGLKLDIPHIIHFHGPRKEFGGITRKTSSSLKEKLINFREKLWFKKQVSKENQGIITISPQISEYAKKIGFSRNICVQEIENSFDESLFTENILPQFPLNDVKLVSVGALNENKNHMLQIKALNELKKVNIKFHLTIVGSGPYKEILKEKVKKYNIENMVSFVGNSQSPQKHLKSAHLFIHTPIQEGFGIAIIEAMACGLPVICTAFKGSNLIVKDGKSGLISNYSSKELADKILHLTQKEPYLSFRKNGLELTKSYQTNQYVEKTLQFYTKLLKR